jgi:hypothetical protein
LYAMYVGALKRRLAVLAIVVAIMVGALECVFRLIGGGDQGEDERSVVFRHHPTLGWFPKANYDGPYDNGFVTIHVRNNSLGFRDVEHAPKRRPRIAFLGDSFVWGYNVEASDRFTDILQAARPDLEVFNLGVSGYGLGQEYLLLQEYFSIVRPDIVFLLVCGNDQDDDSSTFGYGAYYRPLYVKEGGRLVLEGVPVPKSERYYLSEFPLLKKSSLLHAGLRAFLRSTLPAERVESSSSLSVLQAIGSYLAKRNVRLIVGLQFPDPALQGLLEAQDHGGLSFAGTEEFPKKGWGHWTPRGNASVAARIAEYLGAIYPPPAMREPPSPE